MCGSLTQRDLHTFFVSSHLVSLTTYLHIIHHVGRALFGWWRSFSLSAQKEARAENTNDENNAREEEGRKTNGRNPGVERVERLVRLNVEKHLMRKMNAMTTTSPMTRLRAERETLVLVVLGRRRQCSEKKWKSV